MRLEYAGYFSASEIFTQRRYTGLYLLRVVGIIINICNSRTIYPDVESPPYTPEKGYLLSYLILSNTAIQGNSNCSRHVLNVYDPGKWKVKITYCSAGCPYAEYVGIGIVLNIKAPEISIRIIP